MKEKWLEFLRKLNNPPVWALVLNYVLTLVSVIGSIVMLCIGFEKSLLLSIVAYVFFGVAAVSLAYTVYTLVKLTPRIKNGVTAWIERYEFTRTLKENYGFRTVIFTIGSFTIGIAYGLFNGVLGIAYRSIWYGALAAYYILLTFLRGSILLYHKRKNGREQEERAITEARAYRNCGIVLLVLNLALSSAIAQMIFEDKFFEYAGWTIYAFAAYAFYKITMSIVNIFKAKKQDDMTVQALRNTNLIAAAVSLLALQTALLYTFGTEGVNISLYNTLTGSAVSVFCMAMSIFMIVKGRKETKKIRTEKKQDDEQRGI